MTTFALVCEGVTDQVVLERIIEQVCNDYFDGGIYVNPLQPKRDETDARSAPSGGWELVLEYCRSGVVEALESNDYVVIHIDTDCGDHINFGLDLTIGGVDKSCDDLVTDAANIIIKCIGIERYEAYFKRIIFAISVHTIESWLLLYYFGIDHPKNSIEKYNKIAAKRNIEYLKKDARCYQNVVRGIKRGDLLKLTKNGGSLGIFLSRLLLVENA